jgi:hypothetical protein
MRQAGALAGRGPKGAKGCAGETLRFLVKNVFIESRPPVNPKVRHFWGEPPVSQGETRLGLLAATRPAIAADGKWVSNLQTRIVVGFEYGLRKRETLSCRFMPAAGRKFSEAALILKRRSDSRSVLTMPPES